VSIVFLAASLAAQINALPDVVHGLWTTELAACGREDTKGVTIEPRAVTFYEARGAVISASQGSKGTSARVAFTGEGRSWNEAIRLHLLAKDRLELTALGRTQIFERCSSTIR